MSIGCEHEDIFKMLLKRKKDLLIINSLSDVCFNLVVSLVSVEIHNCLLVNTCYLGESREAQSHNYWKNGFL